MQPKVLAAGVLSTSSTWLRRIYTPCWPRLLLLCARRGIAAASVSKLEGETVIRRLLLLCALRGISVVSVSNLAGEAVIRRRSSGTKAGWARSPSPSPLSGQVGPLRRLPGALSRKDAGRARVTAAQPPSPGVVDPHESLVCDPASTLLDLQVPPRRARACPGPPSPDGEVGFILPARGAPRGSPRDRGLDPLQSRHVLPAVRLAPEPAPTRFFAPSTTSPGSAP